MTIANKLFTLITNYRRSNYGHTPNQIEITDKDYNTLQQELSTLKIDPYLKDDYDKKFMGVPLIVKKTCLSVREIIEQYLQENEYDGLYNENGCYCKIDDLMACRYYNAPGEIVALDCLPGHDKFK